MLSHIWICVILTRHTRNRSYTVGEQGYILIRILINGLLSNGRRLPSNNSTSRVCSKVDTSKRRGGECECEWVIILLPAGQMRDSAESATHKVYLKHTWSYTHANSDRCLQQNRLWRHFHIRDLHWWLIMMIIHHSLSSKTQFINDLIFIEFIISRCKLYMLLWKISVK